MGGAPWESVTLCLVVLCFHQQGLDYQPLLLLLSYNMARSLQTVNAQLIVTSDPQRRIHTTLGTGVFNESPWLINLPDGVVSPTFLKGTNPRHVQFMTGIDLVIELRRLISVAVSP